LKELVDRKDSLIKARATPPMLLKADLKTLPLSVETFGTKFDVVLVDPPWEEYVRRAPGVTDGHYWTWQEIMALQIEAITDTPSFVFLWCGSAEGLDAGRHCLQKWGFRRCEDICWIKTNKQQRKTTSTDPQSVLQHTKEHCLMGIKGTVRRATDGHIIHANIDTDIIIDEEPPFGSTHKPEELYHIIERFAQGRRRLELFGEESNMRNGWVTVGNALTTSNFNPKVYANYFRGPDGLPYVSTDRIPGGRPVPGSIHLVGTTEEIENLRPRSPPPHQRH
jgi:N6-adenosine-specific RNA methylase IME4